MQQSIGNNRISLIVNNHIQQFEIKAPTLQFSNRNLKPPLYRGNAHFGGQPHKKNHSLSIHNNGGQYMMNHLKVIPTQNNKKSKMISNNSNNTNANNNTSNTNSINNQAHANQGYSFHRPQSPVVLNISSDRHYLHQQQQQQQPYSFQHQTGGVIHQPIINNAHHQFLNQIGANFGSHPHQRAFNFRNNSIKLKGKLDNSTSSKHISSLNVLQSINSCYQKNNISSMNDSPLTKRMNYGVNGSSNNDQTSDLEKVNNSSSNANTNNGTIMNINNSSSISNMLMNNSSSNNTNSNTNTNPNTNNNNNNIYNYAGINSCSKNNTKNQIEFQNHHHYNYHNHPHPSSETNAITKNNNSTHISHHGENKYRISKTQILFPFFSRENLSIKDNQNALKSSSKNNINIKDHSRIQINSKIVHNQNFQEDEILFNKASSQPTEVLREQMALDTPPQLAAYTTSATTDTIHRQTFRIRPYNMSSRQSSRGGLKSTITSNDPISSTHTNDQICDIIYQINNINNNINNNNNIYNNNNNNIPLTYSRIGNNDQNDLSPQIFQHQSHNNQQQQQQQPIQRILSSRSASKIVQNPRRKIVRQPSSQIIPDDAVNIHLYHPNLNGQNQGVQKEIIVRKNSYWYNQREQLERKKKKEKSILTSNNDITFDAHNQHQATEFSVDDHEDENKHQHLLFRFPTKEDKTNINGKEIEKSEFNNQKRDNNSPRASNPRLSKRQSLVRINQKQQQMLTHQPAPQVQAQQLSVNALNGQISNYPSIFSMNATNTLSNLKSLSIRKVSSIENSTNNNDMTLTSSNPYHDVELREMLGEGAYGKVYKGFMKKTGKFIAVKQLKLSHQGLKESSVQEKLEQYLKEITLLNHLDHPHIVRYYDCKQEDDHILIYMEQMPGGSLSSMLQKFGRFEEALIKKFVKQIMQGLAYLHTQGVVHRDIKGANILSDGNGTVKLADFGAARYRDTLCLPTASGSEFCNSIKGSLYWMAPELLNSEPHGRKSDIWSLGCTIIEMATGKHPWPDCKAFIQLALIVKTDQCPPIPDHLSDVCKDFIRKCCTFDKKERPTSDQLLKHPFLKD